MSAPVGTLRQGVVTALAPKPKHVTVQVGNILVDVLCAIGVEVGDLVWVKFMGIHAWVEDKVRPGIPEPQYALALLRELVAGADDHRGWYIPDEIAGRIRALVAEHTTNEETT